MTALEAIRAQRGLSSAIARALGINKSTVSQWQRVPAVHVQAVSKLTGLPAYRLRPDVFAAPKGNGGGLAKPNGSGKANGKGNGKARIRRARVS